MNKRTLSHRGHRFNIQGERQHLWRAVDQDGDVIDILVEPLRLVTDKLRSYGAAPRTTMPSIRHSCYLRDHPAVESKVRNRVSPQIEAAGRAIG